MQLIIGFSILSEWNVATKEFEKLEKFIYFEMKMQNIELSIASVMISVLGTVRGPWFGCLAKLCYPVLYRLHIVWSDMTLGILHILSQELDIHYQLNYYSIILKFPYYVCNFHYLHLYHSVTMIRNMLYCDCSFILVIVTQCILISLLCAAFCLAIVISWHHSFKHVCSFCLVTLDQYQLLINIIK